MVTLTLKHAQKMRASEPVMVAQLELYAELMQRATDLQLVLIYGDAINLDWMADLVAQTTCLLDNLCIAQGEAKT